MLKNSKLYTAVVISGLLAGSNLIPVAQAGSYTMSPESTWSVTKVDGKGGSAGYCAMVRKYSHNVVLSLAKNTDEDTSLALDFLSNSFDISEKYSVTVSPGSGEKREYTVTPVSAQAVVMRLGKSDAFLDALIASERLGVSVAEHDYTFNMSDLRSGQQNLNACVSGLSNGSAVALVEPEVKRGVSTPSESVVQCVQDNSGELVLKEELKNAAYQLKQIEADNKSTETRLSLVEKDLAEKERQLSQIIAEKKSLEDKLVLASSSEDSQIETLQAEIKVRTQRLSEAEKETSVLNDEIKLLQTTVRDFEVKLLDEKNRVESLEGQLAQAKEDASSMSSVSSPSQLVQALPSIPNVDTSEAQREIFRLGRLLDDQKMQCDSDKARMEKVLFDPELGQKQYQDMIHSLQDELDRERDKADLQRKEMQLASNEKSDRLNGEIDRLTKRISLLEGERALAETKAQGSAGVSKDRMGDLEGMIAKLKSEKGVLSSQIAEEKRQAALSSQRLGEIEEQLKIVKRENSDLQNKILSTDYDEADWVRERADLQLKLAQLQESKGRLMMQLSADETGNKHVLGNVAQLEERLYGLEKEKSTLVMELSSTNQKLDRAVIEKETLEKQLESFSDDRATLKSKLTIAEADKETSSGEAGRLKVKLAEIEQERVRLQNEVTRLSSSLKQVELEFSNYKTSQELSSDEALNKLRAGHDRSLTEFRAAQERITKDAIQKANLEKQAEIAEYVSEYEIRLAKAVEKARLEKDVEFKNYKVAQETKFNNAVEKADLDAQRKMVEVRSNQEDLISAEVNKQLKILEQKHDIELAELEKELGVKHAKEIEAIRLSHEDELKSFEADKAIEIAKASEKAILVHQAEARNFVKSDTHKYSQTVSELKDEQQGDMLRAQNSLNSHPADIMTPMPVSAKVNDVQPLSQAVFMDANEVSQLLRRASIQLVEKVSPIGGGNVGDGKASFVWSSSNQMMGSLEQSLVKAGQDFSGFVKGYLSQSKSRCSGEFAAIESDVAAGAKSMAYEIACVPQGGSSGTSSASLLFTEIKGVWSVFAHETDAASMADSMDARDKISAVVKSSYGSL